MSTMIKKINSFFRSISQDITVTNVTKDGGAKTHHELPDTSTADCHPVEAITDLSPIIESINKSISLIYEDITKVKSDISKMLSDISTINSNIEEINTKLENHEERIRALEG